MIFRLLFLLFACGVACSAFAENTVWELKAQKTGTGGRDFYNLAASVGDSPADYFIAIATNKKIEQGSLQITGNDEPLRVGESSTVKGMLAKANVVLVHLTRQQMESAEEAGMRLHVHEGIKGGMQFTIPAAQFKAMIIEADKRDKHRESSSAVEWLTAGFSPELPSIYLRDGAGVITGQAFLKTRGGDVRVGAGNVITLMPDDGWTPRAYATLLEHFVLDKIPEEARSYFGKVVRTTQADAHGNFTFEGLPKGKYILETIITWQVPSRYGLETTGGKVRRAVIVGDTPAKVMLTE